MEFASLLKSQAIGYDLKMDKHIDIRLADSPEDKALARRIRQQIFVEEQGIPADVEEDGLNETAVHVLLDIAGTTAGTARMCLLENNEGEIARVAITTEFRGRGLGKLLVEALEKVAVEKKLERVFLHPHHYLEKFYAGLDYVLVPGESTSAGEHRLITMEKKLP